MNILFYRYNSICEPDVISAFIELGHSVSEITEEMYRKDVSPKETVEILNRELMKDGANFDAIFSINFYPAISEVCNICHIPYICWSVDSPVLELFAKSITNEWNRVFLFDYGQYLELEPLNPGRIFHLPLATNVAAKDEVIKVASQAQLDRFKSDVSFVGSLYTEKCPYDNANNLPDDVRGFLDGVMNAQLLVYGYFFMEDAIKYDMVKIFKACMPDFYELPQGSYLTDRRTMAQFYMGNKVTALERLANMKAMSEHFNIDLYTGSDTSLLPKINNRGYADPLKEMPIIFNQSRINLNMTSKAIRYGIPLRVWDVLGSGGFLISNYQTEIPEFLVPGEDLVTYGSKEELIDLTRYYLEHGKERVEIATRAYDKIKEYHTFTIRVDQMLKMIYKNNKYT